VLKGVYIYGKSSVSVRDLVVIIKKKIMLKPLNFFEKQQTTL